MTNEEAIAELKQIPKHIGGDCDGYELRAITKAIEALQKQTPTPPNYQGDEACMDAYCPGCGEWLDDGDVLCEKCHQIIDWSDSK